MLPYIQKAVRRVAVIGAGPGGLAAIRALRSENAFEKITVFERNDHVGGTWHYSPQTNDPPPIPSTNALTDDQSLKNSKPLYSPIYEDLHTNLTPDVLGFQDFSFPENTPFFPSHPYVKKYLEHIVCKENLLSLIRLSTRVDKVDFKDNVWTVTVTNLKNDSTNSSYSEEFDAVIVANGHYSVPHIPDFPGLKELNENKKIVLIHSRDYREPPAFKDKNVIVIGAGSSGIDMVREIAPLAAKVYQCIRTPTELSRQSVPHNPANVEQIDQIKRIVNTSNHPYIELESGKQLKDVDVIAFGTGYLYSFPFLPFEKDNLITNGRTVHNLDHYMVYNKNPTICFLGLPVRIVPIPLMHRQSTVMARYWSGKIPMKPDPMAVAVANKEIPENNESVSLVMGADREFAYNDMLGAWAEGWTDDDLTDWQSTDLITGRLTDEWKVPRKNSIALRREYLGY